MHVQTSGTSTGHNNDNRKGLNSGLLKASMKLEAIDPLNLSTICVATIEKVLRNDYLMIRIDGFNTPDGSDLFCYHQTSSSIFPAGFCRQNGIALQPPYGMTIHDYLPRLV
jgi:hypothetical protein